MKSLHYISDLGIRQSMENFYNTLVDLSKRPKTYCTDFYNPKEIEYAEALLLDFPQLQHAVYGGSMNWERAVIFLGPYINLDSIAVKDYVKIIRFINLPQDVSHRDILGTLIHQGINRNVIGDIIIQDGYADIITRRAIGEYLLKSPIQVRNHKILSQEVKEYFVSSINYQYEVFQITVSSLRIDNILGEICRISRSKAQEMIIKGLIKKNYELVFKKNEVVEIGDMLSIRGYGRYIINNKIGLSRKNNLFLEIKKYL